MAVYALGLLSQALTGIIEHARQAGVKAAWFSHDLGHLIR
jgi:hypothetical protein